MKIMSLCSIIIDPWFEDLKITVFVEPSTQESVLRLSKVQA